jgi:hypothetical protein
MLHWDSVGVSNIFLAVVALTNIVILLILYQRFGKK